MDSPTPEKLQLVGAVEAYPDLMPGRLFVYCPDSAKSCVSISACQRLHDETTKGHADPERCSRPCSKCVTGGILWRDESTGSPPVVIHQCPRCGKLARLVGKTNGNKATPWAVCCVSCWNRTSEGKKGRGARGRPITLPPMMNPWLIGYMADGVPRWAIWIGDTQSEAILRQLLRDPASEFHDITPGVPGFDASGHPRYFCRTHRQTALRWDWNTDAPTVGPVRFYCPDCEPQARPLPLATVRPPLAFMTPGEAANVYAFAEGKFDSAVICSECRHAPLRIMRDRNGVVSASCPCCTASADVSGTPHNWIDVEVKQPQFFSVYVAMYADFPLSGSGAAALQLVPPSPLTLERVPQLLFNRLRACILAALGEWDYLDGVAMAIDRERGDGTDLLALLAQLRALK